MINGLINVSYKDPRGIFYQDLHYNSAVLSRYSLESCRWWTK